MNPKVKNTFYLIDKPSGITSFDVIRELRKKLQIKKIGHTGTLDPFATGLLLLAVGSSTKLIPYVEKAKKTYRATIRLDAISDTGDIDGELTMISEEILSAKKDNITKESIQNIIADKFSGKQKQIPPKYSALKINGKRAYELARNGEDFKMNEREVEFFTVDIIDFSFPELIVDVEVSAGTYIRSYAQDLGRELGLGGYLTVLRRTGIDGLSIDQSQTLSDFNPENTIDPLEIFTEHETLELGDEIIDRLSMGQRVRFSGLVDGYIYLVKQGNAIVLVVRYEAGVLHPIKKI